MKNKLNNLNDHLFAQIERLSDEALTPDQMEIETKRSLAMVSISDQVLKIGSLQIQAARLARESGLNPAPSGSVERPPWWSIP